MLWEDYLLVPPRPTSSSPSDTKIFEGVKVIFMVDTTDLNHRLLEVKDELLHVIESMEQAVLESGYLSVGSSSFDGTDDIEENNDYTNLPIKLGIFFNKSDSPDSLSGEHCLDLLDFEKDILCLSQTPPNSPRETKRYIPREPPKEEGALTRREKWIQPFRGSVRTGDGVYSVFEWIGKNE